uniref:Uncharacterized protein n=1 Tax=viral metagenome TaxID=1070528 RepID=A0A6M3LF05_9ZZZZ
MNTPLERVESLTAQVHRLKVRVAELERRAEHLRRENDRLRAAAGNCGGEPMVEQRAQAHTEKEAGNS